MKKIFKFFRTLGAYVISLSTPAALAAAVNEAASVDELDDAVLRKAGAWFGR